ncbi:RNA polymerase sigma factor [Neobacillus sp. D3-1R]|uniref:RNA polymerase sigma factor n=1 Tax=Neobacillus sp. D3-1R TaxID=3445778 RepID=UPI003FA17EE9
MSELEFFETYKWEVYKTCFYMLQDKHEAEDMTQNVFIQIFHQDYHKIANIKSWILKITLNMCRNYLKRKKKVIVVEDIFKMEKASTNLESEFDKKHLQQDMLSLLSKLPDRARDVIILKYLHDMKNREIADLLGITEGTVKASCHYGLKLLRVNISNRSMLDIVKEGI